MAPVPIVNEKYLAHVEAGYCPFTEGKTWCNGEFEHPGAHWAKYLPGPGQQAIRITLVNATDPGK